MIRLGNFSALPSCLLGVGLRGYRRGAALDRRRGPWYRLAVAVVGARGSPGRAGVRSGREEDAVA